MKKIALIRPFFREIPQQQTFPIGLGYLAAVLRNNGFQVKIYDLNILKITNIQFIDYLEKLNFDFIGVTALTWYYASMVEFCNLIRQNAHLENIKIIIGGVHASSLPEFSLRETLANVVVIGEGEKTIIDLLNALIDNKELDEVKGIGFLKNNEYIETEKRDLIKNLDDIPNIAWDLIRPEMYPVIPHGFFYKKAPVYPILTTRGCPFQCIYCASKNFWEQQIRFHSIKRSVDEIEFLVKNYRAKEIHIWDDNFTLKKKHVIEFCKEIIHRKLKVFIACPNGVKIDTLDDELLTIMRKAGFYMLIFAIESGSPKIQKVIKKNIDLIKTPRIINRAKELGYFNRGFFIIGLPNETLFDLHQTINYALKLKLDLANFFIFTPLPGSTFFRKWIKDKDIYKMNWNFDFFNNPQDMRRFNKIGKKDLLKIRNYVYIKFLLLKPVKFVKYLLKFKPIQYIQLVDRLFVALNIKK